MSSVKSSVEQKSARVESLDAFRGIASFLIMVTHIVLFVPQVCQGENLTYIYGALSWKLPYFFILSGFVLTLSYERSKKTLKHPFKSFLVSRVLRIYPLFFITTVVMFLLKEVFGAGAPIDEASIFFNIAWRLPSSFVSLLHALTLVGLENTWLYNGPAWTLVFEMRYAFFFPLFFVLLRKWWASILLFVGMAGIAAHVTRGLEMVDLFYFPNQLVSNFCSMISFLLFYAGGILLALHRKEMARFYESLSRSGKAVVLILAIVAVLNPLWINYVVPAVASVVVGNCVMLVGVALWIVILLNNKVVAAVFSRKMLIALGRSSFSIYMWHTPVAVTYYLLLHESVNVWWIVVLSIFTSLVVAQLSFRYIEQPIINFSRRLRR